MWPARRKTLLLGISIIFAVGTISWWLAEFEPRIGSVTIAILLGVLAGNLFFNNQTGMTGALFAEKQLLPIAITLLGVELQLMTLVELGPIAVVIMLTSIATSMFVSIQLGYLLGFSRSFSILIGAGNGICGSSAVAATSIVINAEEADTGISISVVNLLGTIGIFFIPALIHLFSLSNLQGGLLTGGTLQAFGQVIAAGFSVNTEVGNIATVVKMGRVLMLGPVVVVIGSWMRAQLTTNGDPKPSVQIPRFILYFFIMSIIASLNILPSSILDVIKVSGKYLLVVAMAGIGMRIQLQTLYRTGFESLLFGGIVSLIQIIITLMVIILMT